jgi:hypothetical protein
MYPAPMSRELARARRQEETKPITPDVAEELR